MTSASLRNSQLHGASATARADCWWAMWLWVCRSSNGTWRGSMIFLWGSRRCCSTLSSASHGEVEKGALREPMLAEAVVLHAVDELDAHLEQVWRLIDLAPAGEEWTAYVPSLRRQIYCASINTTGADRENRREGMP